MSPPNPENDPVQKGLHQLGQQLGGGATPPSVPENPVEKGLHELGRQIDEAERAGGRRKGKRTEADAAHQAQAVQEM